MEIRLCNTKSENNVIGKDVSIIATLSCTVKGDISLTNPTVIVNYNSNLVNINYAHIAEWSRWYYVKDVRGLTGGRYEVDLVSDPLQSFADDIKKCPAILSDTQSVGLNKYLPSDVFVTNVKNTTTIIEFSDGLAEIGEYVLITAGG